MRARKKPKNLYIATFEGIDTAGKTTAFSAYKLKLIQQSYFHELSKASLNLACEKYELPLQVEGTPLYDDYNPFYFMNITNNESFLTSEIQAAQTDFFVARTVDRIPKMFLTLPHKGAPSYENIKKVLTSDESIPKRQETRFRHFMINYHESMHYVFEYLDKLSKEPNCPPCGILYTDRSWVSNFVYNGYTGDIENPTNLLKKIKQVHYHPIDSLTLYILDKKTLQERMQARTTLSYYEKFGIERLMKLQEKYLYLVNQLHKIGYVREFSVVNKSIIDVK